MMMRYILIPRVLHRNEHKERNLSCSKNGCTHLNQSKQYSGHYLDPGKGSGGHRGALDDWSSQHMGKIYH